MFDYLFDFIAQTTYNRIMVTITIQGHGTYTIESGKLNELLMWLKSNSVTLESGNTEISGDQVILNG